MSKFIEDFEWEWEFNQRIKTETIREVIKRLKEGEQLEAENNRKCKWKPDEDGIYDTECGGRFEFEEGGPKENRTKYCQYCRGILIQE